MFIELHIVQNFPPSNLNRDDTGQPKNTDFGGVPRARISSQAIKRATRYAGKDPKDQQSKSVFERYTAVPLGSRTKLIVSALTKLLDDGDNQERKRQAEMLAKAFAEAYAGGMDSKDESKTNVLLYMSEQEQREIANKLKEKWDALVTALSPETPLDQVARQLSEKIGQRASEPKDKPIKAKDLTKEIQARLEKSGKEGKEAKSIAGKFKKAFESDAKVFSVEELDWAGGEIARLWDAIQAYEKAESPLVPIVDEFIKETKGRTSAPDIALFGRMLADKPSTNVDAACQMAHAISTHTVNRNDLDYFTAVDDLQPKEKQGAGFLDVAYFNSACFYRYARIDFELLKKNLVGTDDDLPSRTIEAFLRASEAAIPAGKKNSHAHEVRPDFMLAVLRSDNSAGWSMVNAFEKPVNAEKENGLREGSIRRLDEHFNRQYEFYDDDSVLALSVALPSGAVPVESLSPLLRAAIKPKMSEWVNAICNPLKEGK